MKLSILASVATLLITGGITIPAPVPSPTHVAVSQDPSPPRPFPKYALEGVNTLEERDPSALSRFLIDGDDEVHDPSPPRPFPVGHFVSPPVEERDPSAPHKLVEAQGKHVDPSPPRPFPKYPLEGDYPLDERDASAPSRFPSDEEAEAEHVWPPFQFPSIHVVTVDVPSASNIIEPRAPSPLLRVTASGSEAEAEDPSPPRPFAAGHFVDIDPRADALPPHRGHGGFFPPSNPAVATPTVAATAADRDAGCLNRCSPGMLDCCYTADFVFTTNLVDTPTATAPAPTDQVLEVQADRHRPACSSDQVSEDQLQAHHRPVDFPPHHACSASASFTA